MLLQKSKYLFTVLFLIVAVNVSAATNWDIGVIFLGKNEDAQFQNDIQNKITTLKQLDKNTNLKITILNDRPETVESDFEAFFSKAFKTKNSKKLLLIYSHGLGPDGLKDYSTLEFKNSVMKYAPHLDLLWFDACFMANIEFLYEMRNFSELTIASEDSEFASGMPLDSLGQLPNATNNREASLYLAQDYIQSYSYLKNGSLKENVKLTSATISIIENKNLENFVQKFKDVKRIIDNLPAEEKAKFLKNIKSKYLMDNGDLVDLGQMLIELRTKNKNLQDDLYLTSLIRKLNITAVKKTVTNPRIRVMLPIFYHEAILVYGFNNFTNGDQAQYQADGKIYNSIIKPDGFVKGPNNKLWPYIKVNKRFTTLTPFAPNLNEFNYYFMTLDQTQELLPAKSVKRNSDVVEFEQVKSDSPILYTAYTQEIGKNAERYTGINISLPESIPSIDYIDYEFNSLIEWLKL